MTIVELNEMLKGIAGATMARANKTNFIAVPCEDGVAKISVVTALASELGLKGWFRTEDLAFGAETENVICSFPSFDHAPLEGTPFERLSILKPPLPNIRRGKLTPPVEKLNVPRSRPV